VLRAPDQDRYVLMLDTVATGGIVGANRREFDMGRVQGNARLSNVAPYMFVETGGLAGFSTPYSSPGTYNVEEWGSSPHNAGLWRLRIADALAGFPSSIGDVTIRYCGICRSAPPSSSPSDEPSASPSDSPSSMPSSAPSEEPSNDPTGSPKPSASVEPSSQPSLSLEPSSFPSEPPTPTSGCDDCVYSLTVNVDSLENGTITNSSFSLGNVSFIESVTVEISTIYGRDLEIYLSPPLQRTITREDYVLMFNSIAVEGEDVSTDLLNYTMGKVAGDGNLSNVAPYEFVDSGGFAGFKAPFSPQGVYNALLWATDDDPYSAGDWNLVIRDNFPGDPSSVGQVTIKYCGVCRSPSPSSSPSNQPSFSQEPSSEPSNQLSLSAAPSEAPSDEPSNQPSLSAAPSEAPSDEPSSQPSLSREPSNTPSEKPNGIIDTPSDEPSDVPSDVPSHVPSNEPSRSLQPSASPSAEPSTSEAPSSQPSESSAPSSQPSESLEPSSFPSSQPSESFQPSQSIAPSSEPSESNAPSESAGPSAQPSESASPSSEPSTLPSSEPSDSAQPSSQPSLSPGDDFEVVLVSDNTFRTQDEASDTKARNFLYPL